MKQELATLIRAAHDPEFKRLSDFIVVILHRGAPGDRREIDGVRIKTVQKDGFWYINEFNEEVFIPGHRILELKEKQD
jgi:uncharacterized protein (UPF0248 family)